MDPRTSRRTPPWLVGFMYGGAYNGFVSVSLSQLLPERGVSLEREAEMAALILTGSYISFLLTPLVDCGLPRRVWAMLLALAAALCLGSGVLLLNQAAANGGHGTASTALIFVLFIGYLCSQVYSSAIGGMVPNLLPAREHSAASAYLNIMYLGLSGFGGTAFVYVTRHFSTAISALLLPLPVLMVAAPLLWMGHEDRTPRAVGAAMRDLFRNLRATAGERGYLLALLIFLLPSATFALQNLLGGMGADFHVSPERTNFLVGTGMAIACAAGSALGGPLSSRIDRRLLFVAPAMVAAGGSLLMRAVPHTPAVFLLGVLFYNLMAGINYTAFSAYAFQIVGRDNPLSATKYSLCTASANVAIAFSVWLDGRGAGAGGANGALLVDALLSLTIGAPVLLAVWRFSGGFPRPPLEEESVIAAKAGARAI